MESQVTYGTKDLLPSSPSVHSLVRAPASRFDSGKGIGPNSFKQRSGNGASSKTPQDTKEPPLSMSSKSSQRTFLVTLASMMLHGFESSNDTARPTCLIRAIFVVLRHACGDAVSVSGNAARQLNLSGCFRTRKCHARGRVTCLLSLNLMRASSSLSFLH